MAKAMTAVAIAALAKKPGRHSIGGSLYLQVSASGSQSWVFRYRLHSSVREMGLGSRPDVSLAEARHAAAAARQMAKAGTDPVAARQDAKAQAAAAAGHNTFREVADAFMAAHAPGWRNAKHRQQWTATLEAYAYPVMGSLPVAGIAVAEVMRVIEPLWNTKPETASRVRGRIEAVLDAAAARGWRTGDNPARWRGHLANLLPTRGKVARVVHHAALPWKDMPAFMATLQAQSGVAALALPFTVLTAARTGEVIGARWNEIDMAAALWTVPAERMKAGREHRVPLCGPALAILRELTKLGSNPDGFVFPGQRPRSGLSGMAMTALLRRMERSDITVHGFRSTFRDWCAEAAGHPAELAEAALAHTVRDKVEAAYRRGDALEKRRLLMSEWAAWCCGGFSSLRVAGC